MSKRLFLNKFFFKAIFCLLSLRCSISKDDSLQGYGFTTHCFAMTQLCSLFFSRISFVLYGCFLIIQNEFSLYYSILLFSFFSSFVCLFHIIFISLSFHSFVSFFIFIFYFFFLLFTFFLSFSLSVSHFFLVFPTFLFCIFSFSLFVLFSSPFPSSLYHFFDLQFLFFLFLFSIIFFLFHILSLCLVFLSFFGKLNDLSFFNFQSRLVVRKNKGLNRGKMRGDRKDQLFFCLPFLNWSNFYDAMQGHFSNPG